MSKVHKQLLIAYTEYANRDELEDGDRELLAMAQAAVAQAYAPYSKFKVGAAALLSNGVIAQGSNQENASYPVCACAEHSLILGIANQLSQVTVEAIAITYLSPSGEGAVPLSPCGKCRQFLLEFEARQHKPIRIIMAGMSGPVQIVAAVSSLLPLAFGSQFLS